MTDVPPLTSVLRVPLAGPTPQRAAAHTQHWIETMGGASPDELPALIESAWRLARGRSRWMAAGRNQAELVQAIANFAVDGSCAASGQRSPFPTRLTFVFSGMGPQWSGMGRTLAAGLPRFAHHIAAIDDLLAEHYGGSVWNHLAEFDPAETLPTALAQPGNFLIQAALHDLLREENIIPDAIIGHSAGEVAAAYAAGVYTRAEAARVAVVRGRLQARLAGRGAMIAVGLDQATAMETIQDLPGVSLAAINDLNSVTLAGDEAQIRQVEARMAETGVFGKVLDVEVPYHSPVMDEIAGELTEQLSFLAPKPATVPLYSTVVGHVIPEGLWAATYWPHNVRQPVLFAASVNQALADGSSHFLELAPHPVLSRSIDTLGAGQAAPTVTLLSKRRDETDTFIAGISQLGIDGIGRPARRRSAPLPAPNREPKELWDFDESYDSERTHRPTTTGISLLGKTIPDYPNEFDVELSTVHQPWLAGHEVASFGAVLPATLWAELMALAATRGREEPVTLSNLVISQGLLATPATTMVRVSVDADRVTCRSRPMGAIGAWALNATASLSPASISPESRNSGDLDSGELAEEDRAGFLPGPDDLHLDTDAVYGWFRVKGLNYSALFNNLRDIRIPQDLDAEGSDVEEWARVAWASIEGGQDFEDGNHAAWVLDAGLQLMIVAARDLSEATFLPQTIGRVELYATMKEAQTYTARAEATFISDHKICGSIAYYNADRELVARIEDAVFLRNSSDDELRLQQLNRNLYRLDALTPLEVVELEQIDDELASDESEVGQDEPGPNWVIEPDDLATDDLATDDHLADADLADDYLDDADLADEEDSLTFWVDHQADTPFAQHVQELANRPRLALADVEVGAGYHLLWAVPQLPVVDEVAATFDLLNAIGTLEDRSVTVTLVGLDHQRWLFGVRRSAMNALGCDVRVILVAADVYAEQFGLWLDAADEHEVIVTEAMGLNRLTRATQTELTAVSAPALAEAEAEAELDHSLAIGLDGRQYGSELQVSRVRQPQAHQLIVDVLATSAAGAEWIAPALAAKRTSNGGPALSAPGAATVARVVATGDHVAHQPGDLVCLVLRRPVQTRMGIDTRIDLVSPLAPTADPGAVAVSLLPAAISLAALEDIGGVRESSVVLVDCADPALTATMDRRAKQLGAVVVDARSAAASARTSTVDVIVTDTTDEAQLHRLARTLAPHGRFVHVGQSGASPNDRLAVPSERNRATFILDLESLLDTGSNWPGQLVTRAGAWLTDQDPSGGANTIAHREVGWDEFQTLIETADTDADTVSDADNVSDAVSDVAFVPQSPLPNWPARNLPFPLDPEGTYLISGGYGGVGVFCAQWMASRGARRLVLTGRSGKPASEQEAVINLIRAIGVEVEVVAADVNDINDVARVIDGFGPIRGVVHAAGVIADGPLAEIDIDQVRRSWETKVLGAENLRRIVDERGLASSLDFFWLTSSVSSVVGPSLQGTYAAANAALDALAAELRASGWPASALQLGPLAELGMAMADERNERLFTASGLGMLAPRELFPFFDAALGTDAPTILLADVAWAKLARTESGVGRSSVLRHLVDLSMAQFDGESFEPLLALDDEGRAAALTSIIISIVAGILGMDEEELDGDAAFANLGIDSIGIVELQVALSELMQTPVDLAQLFSPDGTIADLAAALASSLDDLLAAADEEGMSES